MTATTVPQGLPARTWNTLLKLTALLAVAVVLIAGSFAIGRTSADDSVTIVRHLVPVAGTAPANDLPPVSLHTGVATADVPPAADAASCDHTVGQNPPC